MFDTWNVKRRIKVIWPTCPTGLEGTDALAARHLFSFLADLEQTAVLYAQKGYGPKQQLQDELFHRDLFTKLADLYGGRLPTRPETAKLLAFLDSQTGDLAPICFAVVGETFVEGIFHTLAKKWAMFDVLEAEEAKHAEFAFDSYRLPEGYEETLANLEEMIGDICVSPYWLAPLAHLIGIDGAADLGLHNCLAHRAALMVMGAEPSEAIGRLEEQCRSAKRACERGLPTKPILNDWQKSRARIFKDQRYIYESVNLPVGYEGVPSLEARVVQATARALAMHPELNRTVRNGVVYEPSEIVVGVRRQHSHNQVMTVYVRGAHLMDVGEISDELTGRTKRLRDRKYRPVPDYTGLEALLPAPRCAAVISMVTTLGVNRPWAVHIPDEGASFSLCVGRVQIDNTVFVGITEDHIAIDGREVGLFTTALERAFQE